MASLELDLDLAASGPGGARPVVSLAALLRRHAGLPPNGGRKRGSLRTGFAILDEVLEGGLARGDLILVGGPPGIGKTIATMQWARNLALEEMSVAYASYDHGEDALFGRLLQLEIGSLPRLDGEEGRLRRLTRLIARGERSLEAELKGSLHLRAAVTRLESYADRLVVARATSATGLAELTRLADGRDVLVVDYLQKVPTPGLQLEESTAATRVAEGLKEIALSRDIVVMAVAAGDREGLTSRRLRMHNLRGAAGLSYEADVVVMLNEKFDAISKAHTAFDSVRAESFKQQVVFTVEKNRDGPAPVDVEFRKDFANYRFDPAGNAVHERLIDDRLMID